MRKISGHANFPSCSRLPDKNHVTGIAVAKEPERELYLAFINGEPEGAIYIDEKGTLYGDKAVMMLTDRESYVLYEVAADIVETLHHGMQDI